MSMIGDPFHPNDQPSSGIDGSARETRNDPAPQFETSVVALVMAGIGGMLAFFGFAFSIVAAAASDGFWPLAIGLFIVAIVLFSLAYVLNRKEATQWRERERENRATVKCQYCGSVNPPGSSKCESCGAPLW